MFCSYNIKEIRLYPLCKIEQKAYGFSNDDEVRNYLSKELPLTENGRFYYNEKGIDLYDTDALILFQYDAKIMGYGIYKDRNCDEKYYEFYPKSIHNTENISAEEFRSIYPDFKKFTRMKKIPLSFLKPISLLLKRKQKLFDASIH